ncbi:uncharacterized protein LOC115662791 [Syzygium oleosum]|uniref:uncharacterized protein LOC115662791 n=1 Tax=Syzygium oleosum TaxID=219896 RepID=UPI0011D1EA9F|nr:uncharacterized protein LOC115662791 [Syzygium oleosum]
MIGHDGQVSPPAPLRARGGPISGSSAAPGRAAGSDGGRSMKWGKEPALAGGSSAATIGSPPPPSKSQKGREAEGQGGKNKSKKAVLDASGVRRLCSLCGRSFKSPKAVYGHMRVHKTPQKQQAEELATILLDLGQRKLDTMEGRETKGDGSALAGGGASSLAAEAQRKKIHMALDLNEEAPEDDDNDNKDYLGDNEVA